jgi:hypothetical protein
MPEAEVPGLRTSGATVEIDGDRVIKTQSPERSRFERERTQFGTRVGSACGMFHVPDILSFDDSAGENIFHFVPGATPLRTYLVKQPEPELLERAGRALAAIHSADCDSSESDVCWHGDYSLGNLLYCQGHDRITIVDWNNAMWTLEPPDRSRGPAGLDLGIALISLFHCRIGAPMHIPQPEKLGSIFLESYVGGRSCFQIKGTRLFISELIRRFERYWLAQRGTSRALAYAPSMIRLRLFLARTEILGK